MRCFFSEGCDASCSVERCAVKQHTYNIGRDVKWSVRALFGIDILVQGSDCHESMWSPLFVFEEGVILVVGVVPVAVSQAG
jgi:hypothetical protein